MIRDTCAADFERILQLNDNFVNVLSPLTDERLADLHRDATYHRVIEQGGQVAAFLLAFREGCRYDSPNYQWFAERYARFLYIDRIVVSAACQGQRLGALLYADLFSFARQSHVDMLACEFDSDPPNEASRRFHDGFGFKEVGSQLLAAGKKRVSLQVVLLLP